uniref:Putative secreted protein n=1 Tax=Anopheles marajoara TaxID=58244 RepID=A0A2M4CGR8_9DIPT
MNHLLLLLVHKIFPPNLTLSFLLSTVHAHSKTRTGHSRESSPALVGGDPVTRGERRIQNADQPYRG